MPRAKGGAKTRRRRKKILKKAKGYVGGRRKLYKTAAETVLRAGAFAYPGRKQKKPEARSKGVLPHASFSFGPGTRTPPPAGDRESTRLDSRPRQNSYAV